MSDNDKITINTLIKIANTQGVDDNPNINLNTKISTLAKWIQENKLYPGPIKSTPTSIFTDYLNWCERNDIEQRLICNITNFGTYMSKSYPKVKVDGIFYYTLNRRFKDVKKKKKK